MTEYDKLNQGLAQRTILISDPAREYDFFTSVMFGGTPIGTVQDFIDIEKEVGRIVMPEEAEKGLDPHRVNYSMAFDQSSIWGQYYFEETKVDFTEAQGRIFGEPEGAGWTPEKRQLVLAARKRDIMSQGFRARVEALCKECALTGGFATKKHGRQVFPMTSSLLNLTGSNLISDPRKCLMDACKALNAKGVQPTRLVLNPTDAYQLTESDDWVAMLDNRRIEGNSFNPGKPNPNGLAYVGTISGVIAGTLSVWTYVGIDPAGNDYLPQGTALLLPDGSIGCVGYTGIMMPRPDGIQSKVAAREAYRVFGEDRGFLCNSFLQGQCAPMPIITRIDGYGVLKGIPAPAGS